MTLEHVLYDVVGPVATIVLNRPDTLNALGPAIRSELAQMLEAADGDSAVRAVVLTGSGRAFSSGADLGKRGGHETLADMYRYYEHVDAELEHLRGMHKPVIASINGLCFGFGLMLAVQCDLLVASDRATFSMIEARMGMSGGTSLPYLIGPQWAKMLMLAGETIDARTAERIGLVLRVVRHDQLAERAASLARRIASMPATGVLLNKRAIDATMDIMGWTSNNLFNRSHAVLTDSMVPQAEASDGRRLQEILHDEGFKAFKVARDQPFRDPWLDEDVDDSGSGAGA